MPPSVAARLIEYAYSLGHPITYDDVYGPVKGTGRRVRATDPKPPPSRAGRKPPSPKNLME